MRRVVIDTSTLVSVVMAYASTPHRAWLRATESCEILASRETFAEIEPVLHRNRLSRFIDPITRDRFLLKFQSSVEWVALTDSQFAALDRSCRDPKDIIFLARALVGKADLIISSDNDLLTLHPWRGINVLTAGQFPGQF
jgi:putative PIN family toxin of toxin-antitoxin system